MTDAGLSAPATRFQGNRGDRIIFPEWLDR